MDGEGDVHRPTVEELLMDPTISFALKDVIRDWSSRDCLDAARDAGVLCRLFEDEADRLLGLSS